MIAPNKGTRPAATHKKNNWVMPVVYSTVGVAVIAVIVALVLTTYNANDADQAKPNGRPTGQITEVTPVAPPSRPQMEETKPEEDDDKTIKPRFDANGKWIKPDNWDELSLQDKTRSMPVGRTINRRPEKPLFHTPSDNKIFRLLHTKPGAPLLGTMRYDQKFVDEFIASLDEPILINKDDSEDEKRAKTAVQQARQELKEAYDRGEDIVEIMKVTEDELHKLAVYKINLQSEVQKALQDDTLTDQEVRDFAEAANVLLEENGLDPIRLPRFFLIREQLHKGDNQ